MNFYYNEQHSRNIVLIALLLSVIAIMVLPQGISGSIYILTIACCAGIVAALIFISESVTKIKNIAEEMSNEYETSS
jgi:hypothetical protein